MPSILPARMDGSGGRPPHFAWRRPRHTLKGRQDAAAVAASREHLADLKTQAAAGAIDLVFLDESEALTHPYLARCRARRGTELRIEAPGQAKKQAMLGAFDPAHRRLLVHPSPTSAPPPLPKWDHRPDPQPVHAPRCRPATVEFGGQGACHCGVLMQ